MTKQKKDPSVFIPDQYEQAAWAQSKLVCGIDEAGRGCLAGPVVTAAAILKPGCRHPLLKDSKVLSQAQREEAYAWICDNAWTSAAIGTWNEIESYNILQTTKRKMVQAYINLVTKEQGIAENLEIILIDAVKIEVPRAYKPQEVLIESFNFGESRSISIAAASIVAKVTRDRLMQKYHQIFPGYGFNQHKGYGTAAHQSILAATGRTIIHRASFLKKIIATHVEKQLLIG